MSNSDPQNQDDKVGPNESTAGAAKASKHDYEVGYCRPPKQHQFQRGQSGNPRGRRRQPVSKKATWEKLMNELVSLHEKGKTRRVTKYECLCVSHLNKAIKGDTSQHQVRHRGGGTRRVRRPWRRACLDSGQRPYNAKWPAL
jgi:Family of unknown function (DUF5681)